MRIEDDEEDIEYEDPLESAEQASLEGAVSFGKLSRQQIIFVRIFDGNIVNSMAGAGYVGDARALEQKGRELLKLPKVRAALENRGLMETYVKSKVADRNERQEFWSSLLRNEDPYAKPIVDRNGNFIPAENITVPMQIRMKAAELLGKAEGDFIEKIEISQTVTLDSEILKSYEIDTPIEAIEAEVIHRKEQKKLQAPADAEDIEEAKTSGFGELF